MSQTSSTKNIFDKFVTIYKNVLIESSFMDNLSQISAETDKIQENKKMVIKN